MPAAYQWSHIGTDVELQNDSELHFTPLHLSDAGNYICIISGVLDNITMDTITYYSNTKSVIIQGEAFWLLVHSIGIFKCIMSTITSINLYSPYSILCYNHK